MLQENKPINYEERVPASYDNGLRVYKARVYSNCGPGDDRLQVRIIPYMNDIPSSELSNLPKYAPLFRGQVIQTKTEAQDGRGDLVWVLAIPDFTFGYVLGMANTFDTVGEQAFLGSWDYEGAKGTLRTIGAATGGFDYKNIYVDMQNTGGTYIEFHNIKKSEKWMLTSTGDVIHIAKGKVYIQASAGTGKGDSRSSISITPTKILCTTDLFEVNAKNVILAKHNMQLLGSLGSSFQAISCDGLNIQPISNIFV